MYQQLDSAAAGASGNSALHDSQGAVFTSSSGCSAHHFPPLRDAQATTNAPRPEHTPPDVPPVYVQPESFSDDKKNYTTQRALFVGSLVDDSALNPYQFRILAHLRRRQGNNEYAWSSLTTISETCAIGRRKVISTLKELEGMGAVHKKKGGFRDGKKLANEYRCTDSWTPPAKVPNRTTPSVPNRTTPSVPNRTTKETLPQGNPQKETHPPIERPKTQDARSADRTPEERVGGEVSEFLRKCGLTDEGTISKLSSSWLTLKDVRTAYRELKERPPTNMASLAGCLAFRLKKLVDQGKPTKVSTDWSKPIPNPHLEQRRQWDAQHEAEAQAKPTSEQEWSAAKGRIAELGDTWSDQGVKGNDKDTWDRLGELQDEPDPLPEFAGELVITDQEREVHAALKAAYKADDDEPEALFNAFFDRNGGRTKAPTKARAPKPVPQSDDTDDDTDEALKRLAAVRAMNPAKKTAAVGVSVGEALGGAVQETMRGLS